MIKKNMSYYFLYPLLRLWKIKPINTYMYNEANYFPYLLCLFNKEDVKRINNTHLKGRMDVDNDKVLLLFDMKLYEKDFNHVKNGDLNKITAKNKNTILKHYIDNINVFDEVSLYLSGKCISLINMHLSGKCSKKPSIEDEMYKVSEMDIEFMMFNLSRKKVKKIYG